MIQGIGIDLVEIERFKNVKDKDDFLQQILAEKEIRDIPEGKSRDIFSATMFAVKEAILKALGCGLHYGSFWHDIEVSPELKPSLHGFVGKLANEQSISKIHITKSRSKKYLVTFVILES
jgi:holo-[acyl-carrier protein] synthase